LPRSQASGPDVFEPQWSAEPAAMSSIPFLLRLLAAVAVLTASARGSRDGDAQMSLSGDDYVCEHPPYKIHMVSKSPRVIYITDFLTPSERAHLRAIT